MKVESLKSSNGNKIVNPNLFRGGSYKAFTLAEILIALTVIGVIAAVTVPVLMQNTNKQEYVTGLKKTYSTLSQVTNQIIAEEGNPKCNEGGWACSSQDIYDRFIKYLNNAKECNNTKNCGYGVMYKHLNRNNYSTIGEWTGSYRHFILADGVLVTTDSDNFVFKDCNWNTDSSTEKSCTRIFVDLNGGKGPNQFGRDTFVFNLKNNGLYPEGCGNNSADCTKTGNGWGCACKVLREGAMNY